MNKFVMGALAIASGSSVVMADPSEDSEWLELDSEIRSLASAVPAQGPIGGWAVLIRSTFSFSSDSTLLATGTPAAGDISGFDLRDTRLAAWGEVGEVGWRMSINSRQRVTLVDDTDTTGAGVVGDGLFTVGQDTLNRTGDFEFELEDAYVHWRFAEYFTAQVGQFRPHVFRSNKVWEENQLFVNRTILGSAFDFFDVGAGAQGDYEDFSWSASVTNGVNSDLAGHLWSLRAEYNLNGGAGPYEGAYGSSDDLTGTIGGVYALNDSQSSNPTGATPGSGQGMLYGVDASLAIAGASVSFEQAWIVEPMLLPGNSAGMTDILLLSSALTPQTILTENSDPLSVTLSYRVADDFEIGFRYQNMHEGTSPIDQLWTAGFSWYWSGMNAKWSFEVTDIEGGTAVGGDVNDMTVYLIGLTVGSST